MAAPRTSAARLLPLLSLAAAGLVACLRLVVPFDHGTWLVAYLALVGFAAQALLSAGRERLLAIGGPIPRSAPRVAAQLGLWNAGVLAVPLGVFLDARLAIVLGAVTLLTALGSFASVAQESTGHAAGERLRYGYIALVVLMACSVSVGVILGWDRPWL